MSREFEGREVRELEFNTGSKIGGFDALDYFGDGSFFLLLAPGHSIGHLNALARTTENTYIYCSGDSFHHSSILRPHAGARLPSTIALPGGLCCSGKALRHIHPLTQDGRNIQHYGQVFKQLGDSPDETPFCTVPETPSGQPVLAVDLQEARDTVKKVQKFDACPDIFVVAAHDASLHGVVNLFPLYATNWKEKGWKEQGQWKFLHDFPGILETA